jgi:hypothetical protein
MNSPGQLRAAAADVAAAGRYVSKQITSRKVLTASCSVNGGAALQLTPHSIMLLHAYTNKPLERPVAA